MGPINWVVVAGLKERNKRKRKKKKKGLGIKYKRVAWMVWCGEIIGDNGFKEVRAGVLFLDARLIDLKV